MSLFPSGLALAALSGLTPRHMVKQSGIGASAYCDDQVAASGVGEYALCT